MVAAHIFAQTINKNMAAQIPTTEDLQILKEEIIKELRSLLGKEKNETSGKWLRSNEVCKLLGVSQSTVQNLRYSGVLPFTKINGIVLFDKEQIEKILESNYMNNSAK
jgi:excisionase family DNA binding protein